MDCAAVYFFFLPPFLHVVHGVRDWVGNVTLEFTLLQHLG